MLIEYLLSIKIEHRASTRCKYKDFYQNFSIEDVRDIGYRGIDATVVRVFTKKVI